jgi:hypothetical protein
LSLAYLKIVKCEDLREKSEICISGIAIFRRHSLPTQPRRRDREKKREYV